MDVMNRRPKSLPISFRGGQARYHDIASSHTACFQLLHLVEAAAVYTRLSLLLEGKLGEPKKKMTYFYRIKITFLFPAQLVKGIYISPSATFWTSRVHGCLPTPPPQYITFTLFAHRVQHSRFFSFFYARGFAIEFRQLALSHFLLVSLLEKQSLSRVGAYDLDLSSCVACY